MNGAGKAGGAKRRRTARSYGGIFLGAAVIFTLAVSAVCSRESIGSAAVRAAELSAELSVPQGADAVLAGAAGLLSPVKAGAQRAAGSSSAPAASAAASAAAYAAASSSAVSAPAASSAADALRAVKTVKIGAQTGGSYENCLGICVWRQTSQVESADIRAQLAAAPQLAPAAAGRPQVLIIHTHTTEAFVPVKNGRYDPNAPTRDTDKTRSVVRVGDEAAKYLTKCGVEVIHDTEYYDYPVFDGAYSRSLAATQAYLKKYPSIRAVIDLHRGLIQQSDGTRLRPAVQISGKSAAQIALIAGCGEPGSSLAVPEWRQNYRFALRLQRQLVRSYPGLARPLELADKQYNQQACRGSLLVEIGTDVNSLDEVVYSGQLLGRALAQTLKDLK